jgi:hypothetical protein
MDDQGWKVLLQKINRIESQVDKLIEFRGWVLGAACLAGAVGGLIFQVVR